MMEVRVLSADLWEAGPVHDHVAKREYGFMESADIIFQESKQASWHHRRILLSTAPFHAPWTLHNDMTL